MRDSTEVSTEKRGRTLTPADGVLWLAVRVIRRMLYYMRSLPMWWTWWCASTLPLHASVLPVTAVSVLVANKMHKGACEAHHHGKECGGGWGEGGRLPLHDMSFTPNCSACKACSGRPPLSHLEGSGV
jgi:hypothetical protein